MMAAWLSKILVVSQLGNHVLKLVQGPKSFRLHVHGNLAANRIVCLLGLLEGDCESLVFKAGCNVNSLVVDKAGVPL
jgi:hypothetical protein